MALKKKIDKKTNYIENTITGSLSEINILLRE